MLKIHSVNSVPTLEFEKLQDHSSVVHVSWIEKGNASPTKCHPGSSHPLSRTSPEARHCIYMCDRVTVSHLHYHLSSLTQLTRH